MAPSYSRNQNRRQNRTGYVDHDVLEGIPVRQWRRDYVTVAPPPTHESATSQNDIWAVELPHGMPKDSHLLPQHSQDLLRAARSGRIYKRPAPVEEEEIDPDTILGDKTDKKDDETKDRGFTAKGWKPIPRHIEVEDIEYLAKRRKGLITATSKPAVPGPTVTKTTVRRTDAAGNKYVEHVVAAHGQPIEGEIIATTVIPDPSALAVDGYALLPTPSKKKPTSSRKKAKGPGRGRKKKASAPTSVPQIPAVGGVVPNAENDVGAIDPEGVKIEADASAAPSNNEDTEMGDGSMAASDDEEGEDGEDGDEGDDDEGSLDNHGSPSKPQRLTTPPQPPVLTMKELPDLGPAPIPAAFVSHLERERSDNKSGSPLKNVALTTSSLTSPLISPSTAAPPPFSKPTTIQSEITEKVEAQTAVLDEEMQIGTVETAPPILPPPPPEPTRVEEVASEQVLQEEEEEEAMLLDIVENANNAQIGGTEIPIIPPPEPIVEPVPTAPEPVTPEQLQEQPGREPEPKLEEQPDASPEAQLKAHCEVYLEERIEEPLPEMHSEVQSEEKPEEQQPKEEHIQQQQEPPQPEPIDEVMGGIEEPEKAPVVEEEDDDFPDLLGGLEKSLNRQPPQAPEVAPELMPELAPEAAPQDAPVPVPDLNPIPSEPVAEVKDVVAETETEADPEPKVEAEPKVVEEEHPSGQLNAENEGSS